MNNPNPNPDSINSIATGSISPQRDSHSSPTSDQSRNDAQLSMMSMLVSNLRRNNPLFQPTIPQPSHTSRSYLPYNFGFSDSMTASATTNNSMISGSLGNRQGERGILPTLASSSHVDATTSMLLSPGLPLHSQLDPIFQGDDQFSLLSLIQQNNFNNNLLSSNLLGFSNNIPGLIPNSALNIACLNAGMSQTSLRNSTGTPSLLGERRSEQEWHICSKCDQRAFRNPVELMTHEISCRPIVISSPATTSSTTRIPTTFSQNSRPPAKSVAASATNTFLPPSSSSNLQNRNSNSKRAYDADSSIHKFKKHKKGRYLDSDATNAQDSNQECNELDMNETTLPKPSLKEIDRSLTRSGEQYYQLIHPTPLAMEGDKTWLTPLHCFVRRYCVEVFTTNDSDISSCSPNKGKRRAVHIGQVGIRCPYCHSSGKSSSSSKGDDEDDSAGDSCDGNSLERRGSIYYPTSINSIYYATMNLLQRHLHACRHVPDRILSKYNELRGDDARSGTSKKYWIHSARMLGLVDTDSDGIRIGNSKPTSSMFSKVDDADDDNDGLDDASTIRSNETTGHPRENNKLDKENLPRILCPITSPEDSKVSTKFSYTLLSQIQSCYFTEADRLGKRVGLPFGFPGLACKHCYGGYGSGRYFPSSIKTMADTSKTLNVLFGHMMKCRKCPVDIKEQLRQLRETHDDERSLMKFGSQKAFFTKLWHRLHSTSSTNSHEEMKAVADDEILCGEEQDDSVKS